MSVCSQRPTTPGFFTGCYADIGACKCGREVTAEVEAGELVPEDETCEGNSA